MSYQIYDRYMNIFTIHEYGYSIGGHRSALNLLGTRWSPFGSVADRNRPLKQGDWVNFSNGVYWTRSRLWWTRLPILMFIQTCYRSKEVCSASLEEFKMKFKFAGSVRYKFHFWPDFIIGLKSSYINSSLIKTSPVLMVLRLHKIVITLESIVSGGGALQYEIPTICDQAQVDRTLCAGVRAQKEGKVELLVVMSTLS